MSHRTQITLPDRQYELLRHEAFRSGLPMAELVRRAIMLTYEPKRRPTIRGYEVGFSVWRHPDVAVVGRVVPRRGRAGVD
jgi:Ribbon-helix-helix protein, copG family